MAEIDIEFALELLRQHQTQLEVLIELEMGKEQSDREQSSVLPHIDAMKGDVDAAIAALDPPAISEILAEP